MKSKIAVVFLFVIVLIIIIRINESPPKYHTETYIVQAGDTAWSIMNEHNFANKDIRELIYYIEQDNGIKAGYLQIGQELQIRIYENKKSDVNAGTFTPEKELKKLNESTNLNNSPSLYPCQNEKSNRKGYANVGE